MRSLKASMERDANSVDIELHISDDANVLAILLYSCFYEA